MHEQGLVEGKKRLLTGNNESKQRHTKHLMTGS